MDVHGRIREVLAETIREELAPEHQQLSTEDLIKALRQRGIIDDVMKELKFVTDVNEKERTSSPKPSTHFVDREPPVLKKSSGWKSFSGTSSGTRSSAWPNLFYFYSVSAFPKSAFPF